MPANSRRASPRPPGRPTKLTPATQKLVCTRLRKGMTQERAARLSGIGERTFYTWMTEGEAEQARGEEGLYAQFRQAVIRATDEYVESLYDGLEELSDKKQDPSVRLRAITFTAAHRFPEEFGRRQELSGPKGGAIPIAAAVVTSQISPEAARELPPETGAAMVLAWLGARREPEGDG